MHAELIANYKNLEKKYQSPHFASDFIGYGHADFLAVTKFNRLGIHHGTLPPGARLSLPHCESLEEEFVFILEGEVDLWLDGYIYPMKAFDAVGFPSGTGLNHTVINNSGRDARVLVVGERSKKENRFWYPLNPEKKAEYEENWWVDAPKVVLGPHNGKPGPVRKEDLGTEHQGFIFHTLDLKRDGSFSYPNSTETFSSGHRLTTSMNLQVLGIWLDCLEPGKRSSWPHAHKLEEEFCFVVSGSPKVWMNGYLHALKPGDGVAFPPNSNIAHCLINDSNEPALMIGLGESVRIPDEKIIYPKHAERNEEMRAKNMLWVDAPQMQLGPHQGAPGLL